MNKVILLGRLVKDPELATTTNGVSNCKFTLAVTRKYKNQNGETETDFLNCVCWRTLAENVNKFMKKGSQVVVIGSVQTRTYDAQDGTKRYVTEIMADEVEFVSSPKTEGGVQATQTVAQKLNEQQKLIPISDEDLPF